MAEKYTLPRGYLSASQVGSYLRCGRQYFFRYIQGVTTPPNVAMMTGTACHQGFETYFQDCIDTGKPSILPGKNVAEMAISNIEQEVEEKNLPLVGEEKDRVVKEIEIAVVSYIDHVAPTVTPITVEQEIRFELAEGIEILAYIDLVRKNEEGKAVVCDYKITGKKWSLGQLTNNLQFLLYSIGMGVEDLEIHNMRKIIVPAHATKDKATGWASPSHDVTNNIRILRHTFNQESEKTHIINLTKSVASSISKGIFMPCPPDAWNCNPKWCGYWDLCRGGAKGG